MGIKNYEEQVYAGVLGKVIGVYMGRPFEGWRREAIKERWGEIRGYVHEDAGKPLVVADDDISGTFTFIRALADSGKYADTPPDFFGKTWLNYLLEGQTILWWGGVGQSTEHTAYVRLKQGIPSPVSGSMELNGKEVSEQIGAQIFIDAFGMVAPGDPQLAARLAENAARVSHDGEAVNAAKVVAAMVSIAFVEKRMERVLDKAVRVIPPTSLIARVHADVRAWSKKDGDWEKTFARIEKKYGYEKYDGNCHVVPNHAVMVMAWSYAKENFHDAQRIVNSAGWDTDCNAANVGAVEGVIGGVDGIVADYDFVSPFAGRVMIPTATGDMACTDCAKIAEYVAAVGRKIMGCKTPAAYANLPWHNFKMPLSMHGYMADGSRFECRGNAEVFWDDGLEVTASIPGKGRFARVLTPVAAAQIPGDYAVSLPPAIYDGQTVTVKGRVGREMGAPSLRLVAVTRTTNKEERIYRSPAKRLAKGAFEMRWKISCERRPVMSFGFEVSAPGGGLAAFRVSSVDCSGRGSIALDPQAISENLHSVYGWISSISGMRGRSFENDRLPGCFHLGNNEGESFLVTGSRAWRDCHIGGMIKMHGADALDALLRYQGTKRFYAVRFGRDGIKIVLNNYGETVLAESAFKLAEERPYELDARAEGKRISVKLNGVTMLEAEDSTFDCGGAGFGIKQGLAGFRDIVAGGDTK